jgi:hypothetical protein
MQILLEGQEALDYLTYLQEQAKSIEEIETIADKFGKPILPTAEQIAEPTRERHVVDTQADIANDILSEIEQPRYLHKAPSGVFPIISKPKYYRWTEGDIHTLHACALSPRPSIRSLSYIHHRFDTSKVSEQSVRSKLYSLGYKIKKGTVCLPV